jgi:hypothetical protein
MNTRYVGPSSARHGRRSATRKRSETWQALPKWSTERSPRPGCPGHSPAQADRVTIRLIVGQAPRPIARRRTVWAWAARPPDARSSSASHSGTPSELHRRPLARPADDPGCQAWKSSAHPVPAPERPPQPNTRWSSTRGSWLGMTVQFNSSIFAKLAKKSCMLVRPPVGMWSRRSSPCQLP